MGCRWKKKLMWSALCNHKLLIYRLTDSWNVYALNISLIRVCFPLWLCAVCFITRKMVLTARQYRPAMILGMTSVASLHTRPQSRYDSAARENKRKAWGMLMKARKYIKTKWGVFHKCSYLSFHVAIKQVNTHTRCLFCCCCCCFINIRYY